MAILKAKEIAKMSEDERSKRLKELTLELSKERGSVAVGGTVKNPGKIREVRRTIARLKTSTVV